MAKVSYIEYDGQRHDVDRHEGATLMQGAADSRVGGILAVCGGTCSCATCHPHVDESWFDRLEPPADDEQDLPPLVEGPQPTSRLSCQPEVTAELDGLIVRLPEQQG